MTRGKDRQLRTDHSNKETSGLAAAGQLHPFAYSIPSISVRCHKSIFCSRVLYTSELFYSTVPCCMRPTRMATDATDQTTRTTLSCCCHQDQFFKPRIRTNTPNYIKNHGSWFGPRSPIILYEYTRLLSCFVIFFPSNVSGACLVITDLKNR